MRWPPRLIASAHIAADGTLSRALGITAAAQNATGDYSVTLTNEYESGTLQVDVSPLGATPVGWSWQENLPPSTDIDINLAQATDGAAVDAAFSIRVYLDS